MTKAQKRQRTEKADDVEESSVEECTDEGFELDHESVDEDDEAEIDWHAFFTRMLGFPVIKLEVENAGRQGQKPYLGVFVNGTELAVKSEAMGMRILVTHEHEIPGVDRSKKAEDLTDDEIQKIFWFAAKRVTHWKLEQ